MSKKGRVTTSADALVDALDVPVEVVEKEKPKVLFFEDDAFIKKWSGPMILGPFTIAVYALIIIVSGEIVLSTWVGSCGYALNSFVSASIAVSYLFLLVYSWVFVGDKMSLSVPVLKIKFQVLTPFTSLYWLMGYYSIIGIVSFIIWIVGAAFLSLGSFCAATAPVLYRYTMFLVASYAVAFFIVLSYVIKLRFGFSIMSIVKENMKQPSQEELEERIFRKKFAEFDKDGSYQISKDDVGPLLQVLGVYVPDEEIPDLISSLDKEGTGLIHFDVIFDWFKKLNAADDAVGIEADDFDDDDSPKKNKRN